ncbi:MAG: 2-oxoacid:ferredoxin oxidoreductase subunit beta [Myxococcota bacterium]
MTANPPLKKKDFESDQLVRWCPGCGDYAILAHVQATFAKLGIPQHDYAVIAGIGCSSRFPYYMETYGFHTIHGRAPAFATGLKTTRPELSVWLVTGDGDGLSIGGNHLIHLFRRNVDINVMLFNNRIYGLTKGQYSPTSEVGKRTKSTPMGSLDTPFNPLLLALGAGSTYVARSVDVFAAHMKETLEDMPAHAGTSFVEIYQNCLIFNDKAFENATGKVERKENVMYLKAGEPLVYGKEHRFGYVLDGLELKRIEITDEAQEAGLLKHDPTNKLLATMLASFDPTKGDPVVIGLFYREDRVVYDQQFQEQADAAVKKLGTGDLRQLIHAGDTWTVR